MYYKYTVKLLAILKSCSAAGADPGFGKGGCTRVVGIDRVVGLGEQSPRSYSSLICFRTENFYVE